MRIHWKDHLADGHPPKIIDTDIRETIKMLEAMRAEIMHNLGAEQAANTPEEELPLPFALLNGQKEMGQFASLADAVQAGNKMVSASFVSEHPLSETDILVAFEDTTISLPEAQVQLACQTLNDAGDVLEAIAIHGDFDKQFLVQLAKNCRVVLNNNA